MAVPVGWHRAIDKAEEAARPEGKKIGTTGRGIGPAYAAKVGRYGMRVGDILRPNFLDLVRDQVEEANRALKALGAQTLDADEMVKLYTPMVKALMPYVTDTIQFLHENLEAKKSLLFEGAQATMLDIDFGTYPFVTSSNPTAGGACTGSGVSPRAIDRVIGVLKLYTTRVGEGPFPTELFDADGETLRQRGGDRQANSAIHIIAIGRLRTDERTKEYVAKKGIVQEDGEEENSCMSGIPSRPYCKGRNYDPNRYVSQSREE